MFSLLIDIIAYMAAAAFAIIITPCHDFADITRRHDTRHYYVSCRYMPAMHTWPLQRYAC